MCFAAAAAAKQPRGNRGFGRSTAQTDATTPLSVAGLLHLANHGEDSPGHLADEDHAAMIREIDQLRQVLEGQPQGEQGLPPGNASCQTDAQGLLGWQLAQLHQRPPPATSASSTEGAQKVIQIELMPVFGPHSLSSRGGVRREVSPTQKCI